MLGVVVPLKNSSSSSPFCSIVGKEAWVADVLDVMESKSIWNCCRIICFQN